MSNEVEAQVQSILKDFDGRDDFRAGLREAQSALRERFQFLDAMRVGRVLRSPRLFEKLYEQAVKRAIEDLKSSGRILEFGDGEFARWFIEWFGDGGWEIIIEFIKALVPIFAGLSVQAIMALFVLFLVAA